MSKDIVMSKYLIMIRRDRRYYLLLILIAFLFIGLLDLNAQTEPREIKVMTYNIYHGEQPYNPGNSNLPQIAELINKLNPDFVALQEVDSMTNRSAGINSGEPKDLVLELSRMTGMTGFFGKAIDYSDGGYGEGILSRFPARATKYSLPIPKGGEERALLMINCILPGGREIVFAGTHLCHQFEENRLAQTEAICKILGAIDKPVILAGDFNFRPESEPYQLIVRKFADAAVIGGDPEPTISFENPRNRIDYVFLSGNYKWNVKDVEVIRCSASDHMPVMVILEIED